MPSTPTFYAKKWTKTGSSVVGWPTGTVRWQVYQNMTCTEAKAAFLALPSWAARVDATVATIEGAGYVLGDERECSGGGTNPPIVIVPPVAGDPASYGLTSSFTYPG